MGGGGGQRRNWAGCRTVYVLYTFLPLSPPALSWIVFLLISVRGGGVAGPRVQGAMGNGRGLGGVRERGFQATGASVLFCCRHHLIAPMKTRKGMGT